MKVLYHYKVFHDTPEDVYPSISIWFQSHSGPFVDTEDIKKSDIANMLNGRTAFNKRILGNLTYKDITMQLEVEKNIIVCFQILFDMNHAMILNAWRNMGIDSSNVSRMTWQSKRI